MSVVLLLLFSFVSRLYGATRNCPPWLPSLPPQPGPLRPPAGLPCAFRPLELELQGLEGGLLREVGPRPSSAG